MSVEIGENLSIYKNIEVLEAPSASGLRDMIKQIRSPIKILHMYSDGEKHYVWLLTHKKMRIKIVNMEE